MFQYLVSVSFTLMTAALELHEHNLMIIFSSRIWDDLQSIKNIWPSHMINESCDWVSIPIWIELHLISFMEALFLG